MPRADHPRHHRPRTRAFATAVGVLAATFATVLTAAPAHADHQQVPADRTLVSYVVQPGDTVFGLAVEHHAWTAEIVAHNHLGRTGALQVG